MLARKSRPRPEKLSIPGAKRLLQQSDPERTSAQFEVHFCVTRDRLGFSVCF